jgi:hypothetical protein
MNKTHRINDPLESKSLFRMDDNRSYEKLGGPPRGRINKEKEKYNITCFTTDKNYGKISIPGWGLPKMWTHYGDNHKGICIVLNKDKFIKENYKIIKFKGLVKYKLKFDFLTIGVSNFETSNKNYYIDEFINTHYKELFFQKHYDWRSESEFRIVSFETNYCSIFESIEGIIYGLNTPLHKMDRLTDRLDTEGYLYRDERILLPLIDCYQLSFMLSEFVLISYKNRKFDFPCWNIRSS